MIFATVSKSEQLEDYVVKEILPKYRSGEKIPSELELARDLRTSRPTMHKVLSNLTAKGLLYRENGVGTFVSAPKARSQVISVVVPSVGEMSPAEHYAWFCVQYLLEGFTGAASREGFASNLVFLHPDRQPLAAGLERLLRHNTDVYLFPDLGGNGPLIEGLRAHGKICLTRWAKATTVTHAVYGENRAGVREVVAFFAAAGRKKIAFFGNAPDFSAYAMEKYLGYCEGMAEAGLEVRPDYLRVCAGFSQDAHGETLRMLAAGLRPDAIFAGSDLRAFGILEALREAGVRVPEDVLIVGADNLPEGLAQNPPLATLDYPLHRMGEALFAIYREVLANPEGGIVNRPFPCRFIHRASCGSTDNHERES